MFIFLLKSRVGLFTRVGFVLVCIVLYANTAEIKSGDGLGGDLFQMTDDLVTDFNGELSSETIENEELPLNSNDIPIEEMPGCSNDEKERSGDAHLIVSTLDGRVTSFDLESGTFSWSHNIGQMPLLSSSSQNLIMKSDGETVRLAPSLDGFLYQINKNNNMDPLPIEADTLLTSSVNIAEDVSFTGKKTSEVLGVSMTSGAIVYRCGARGCSKSHSDQAVSETDSIIPFYADKDILVLRKVIYDVLAFDLHQGTERFNISFGQQDVQLVKSSGCKDKVLKESASSLPLPRFVIPAGTVCAENEGGAVVWKKQLGSPITSAWKLINGKLTKVDLLQATNIPALTPHSSDSTAVGTHLLSQPTPNEAFSNPQNNPDVYVGIADGHVYVQHSDRMRGKINAYIKQSNYAHSERNVLEGTVERPSIEWKPFEARGRRMMPASEQYNVLAIEHKTDEKDVPSDFNTHHSVSANNIGFFLFFNESISPKGGVTIKEHDPEGHKKCPKPVEVEEGNLDGADQGEIPRLTKSLSWSGAISSRYITSAVCAGLLAYFLLKKDRGVSYCSNLKRKACQFYCRYVRHQVCPHDKILVNPDLNRGAVVDADTFLLPEVVKDTKIHIGNPHHMIPYFRLDEADGKLKGRVPMEMNPGSNRLDVVPPPIIGEMNEGHPPQIVELPAPGGQVASLPAPGGQVASLPAPSGQVASLPAPGGQVASLPAPGGQVASLPALGGQVASLPALGGQVASLPAPGGQVAVLPALREGDNQGAQTPQTADSHSSQSPGTGTFPSNTSAYEILYDYPSDYVDTHNDVEFFEKSERILMQDVLGWGGFGIVFKAIRLFQKQQVAIKRIHCPKNMTAEDFSRIRKETVINSNMANANIVHNHNTILMSHSQEWDNSFEKWWRGRIEEKNFSDVFNTPCAVEEPSTSYSETNNSLAKNTQQHNGDILDFDEDARDLVGVEFNYGDGTGDSSQTSDSGAGSVEDSCSGIVFESSNNSVVFEKSSINSLNVQDNKNLQVRKKDLKLKIPKPLKSIPDNDPRRYIYIILELCQDKTLNDWMEKENTGDKSVIHNYFLDMINGIEYIHDKGYIHRDLKPSNILFGLEDEVVKIADFGLVTLNSEVTDEEIPGTPGETQKTLHAGTEMYMSPEVKTSSQYDYKVDIYSLGLILFEMLVVTKTVTERKIKLKEVKEGKYPHGFAEEHPEEYKLLQMMLHTDPTKRPAAKGIRTMEPLRRLQNPSKLSKIHESEHFCIVTRHRRNTSTGSTSINILENLDS